MDFRDLHAFNIALLAKHTWKVITEPISLCARVLKINTSRKWVI